MEQMREKYESLSAFVLKDLAKARGIKGVSSLKKGQIIERNATRRMQRRLRRLRKTVQPRGAPTLLKMIMQHSTVEKRQKAYLR